MKKTDTVTITGNYAIPNNTLIITDTWTGTTPIFDANGTPSIEVAYHYDKSILENFTDEDIQEEYVKRFSPLMKALKEEK